MLPSTLYIMWPIQLQSLNMLRLTVKEEIQLQENTIFDLDLGVRVTRNVAQYPLHHVTYSPTKFEVAIFGWRPYLYLKPQSPVQKNNLVVFPCEIYLCVPQ